MPTDIYTLSNALVAHLLDHWPHTPITRAGSGGVDITGSVKGDLFSKRHDFLEIMIYDAGRSPAGINYASGTKSHGFIDINVYTNLDMGDSELVRLTGLLYPILERKRINSAQVRPVVGATKPYEYRGRLCKTVSFPFEFFSGPVC